MPLYQGVSGATRTARHVIPRLSQAHLSFRTSLVLQPNRQYQQIAAQSVIQDAEASGPLEATDPSQKLFRKVYSDQTSDDLKRPSINSFKDLRYEAYLEHVPDPGRPRLVDNKDNVNNHNLWARILDARRRFDGFDGMLAVWRGMRRRNVILPINGQDAAAVWLPLLDLCFARPAICDEVWDYIVQQHQRNGHVWPPLYVHFMRHFLYQHPDLCLDWHTRFKQLGLPKAGMAKQLITAALQNARSTKAFRAIYQEMPDRNIHDQIVERLCRSDYMKHALDWHKFLVSIGDFPQNRQLLQQLVDFAEEHDNKSTTSDLKNWMNKIDDHLEPMETFQAKALSGDDINRMIDQARGVEPRQVSDEFAARAIATRAFSLTFIMKTLNGFGWRTLGPLAMHEIAIRCKSLELFRDKMRLVQEQDVRIRQSAFNSMMLHALTMNDEVLFEDLTTTDVHPDCFEDESLQLKLLAMYAKNRQWVQFNRTMTVLTRFLKTERLKEMGSAWNSYVKELIKNEQIEEARRTVVTMLKQHIQVYPSTISQSFYSLAWTSMQAGKAASKPPRTNTVTDLTNLWLAVLQHGGTVPTTAWSGVLTLYGTRGRMAELEALCMHLMHYYTIQSPKSGALGLPYSDKKPSLTLEERRQLRDIFFTQRLAQIVKWGFQTMSGPNMKPGELQWARGLRIVKGLQDRGLNVSSPSIRRACKIELLTLFGGQAKERLRHRRRARVTAQQHGLTLQGMVEEINGIWGETLFKVPDKAAQLEQEVFGRLKRGLKI